MEEPAEISGLAVSPDLTEKLLIYHHSQERNTDLRIWESVEMLNFISLLSLAQRVQPESLSQWSEYFFVGLCFLVSISSASFTSSQSHTICALAHTAVNRILEWIFHIRTEVEQLCWKGCKCSSEELSLFCYPQLKSHFCWQCLVRVGCGTTETGCSEYPWRDFPSSLGAELVLFLRNALHTERCLVVFHSTNKF